MRGHLAKRTDILDLHVLAASNRSCVRHLAQFEKVDCEWRAEYEHQHEHKVSGWQSCCAPDHRQFLSLSAGAIYEQGEFLVGHGELQLHG